METLQNSTMFEIPGDFVMWSRKENSGVRITTNSKTIYSGTFDTQEETLSIWKSADKRKLKHKNTIKST